ncbi:MAG: ATP-grasp domain-containing protein [Candidatus Nanosyncoccaceae bacterium]|jgi:glutathione synthase/RimK-type ligase-like ATP-grasp enzyme
MKQHLLVTTTADLSIEQFRPLCDIVLLNDSQSSDKIRAIEDYRSVYVRSHFSRPDVMPQNFTQQIDEIGRLARQHDIPLIDNMGTAQEIVNFEDKWRQYQIFSECMPKTQLATKQPDNKSVIFKKRISSRATGIVWRREDIVGDLADWICQPLLNIQEELRVYIVRGEVIKTAAVRQSKTTNQAVKVVGVRELTEKEESFAQLVHQRRPELDFIGLDIVITPEELRLIEVNRSPDFASFARESQLNLVEKLYDSTS